MSSWNCQVCRLPVSHGGVGFNYKIWHNNCFRCFECRLLLNNYNYRARNGIPYCMAHYRSDPSDDKGSFVMLPLAGMKKIISDIEEAFNLVDAGMVTPFLPSIMPPRRPLGESIINLPILFPHASRNEQQILGSESKTPSSSLSRTAATTIEEPEKKNRVIVSISAAGDKTMELAIRSICEEEVDVIVNSIGTNLDMKIGGLAKAIRRAAGADIEKELVQVCDQSPAESGSIIATKGYKLPCQHVLHVILKSWSKSEQCVQDLRQLIHELLSKAEQLGARSIAFPLLGTGVLGYPKNTVAQVLYMEVTNYLEGHIDSCLQKVVFSVPPFEEELIRVLRDLLVDKRVGRELPLEEVRKYGSLMTEYTSSRRGSMVIKPPKRWLMKIDSKQPYKRVELESTDKEYKDIVGLMSNRNGRDFTKLIYKIERIENYFLWVVYNAMKQEVNRVAKGMLNERMLWHGTQLESLESIIASGFNRCYSGRALFGRGVYFAYNFSYSAHDTYSPPDPMGCKYIFQCRVLTGYFCKGYEHLLQAPINIKTHMPYNSAVDSLEAPKIFVTFKDYTMYPEYLITLLRTEEEV